MNLLGVSAFYHDAAAALVQDGTLVAAAQEERFSRIKHDPGVPGQAIKYCLDAGGVGPRELDGVIFYDKPLMKFSRMITSAFAVAPRGLTQFVAAIPIWMKQKLWVPWELERSIEAAGRRMPENLWYTEHHEAHAASAFYPSPFERAAILTVDGVGEWATASIGRGEGPAIELLEELRYPHSLGLLYSAFTGFCGFAVNDGEYKLMGLAPYGRPRYVDAIQRELIDLREDGSLQLNQRYFAYLTSLQMTNHRFAGLFGGPARRPGDPITDRERDLARSIQAVTEEVLLRMARHAHAVTKERHLCLAGGVALNCVANGRLLREGPFADIWIQPAAGDAGGAIGAALSGWHHILHHGRETAPAPDGMHGALLGPEFDEPACARALAAFGLTGRRFDVADWAAAVAARLAAGKVVGVFQGRMEFGPRALGSRSILADPRQPEMATRVNERIKFRETFRPFAPAVLAERATAWFDLAHASPYMLLTAPIAGGATRLPAITHVDGSARVQTVDAATHPRFHALLSAFEAVTGCPVLLNTSFNRRDEPIVCTPEDACRCFLGTSLDALALGPFLVER